jgi:hypothetical protein
MSFAKALIEQGFRLDLFLAGRGLNHFVILNAKHLKRTLKNYFRYYEPIWARPSSVQFLGRYRVGGESSKFRNSVGYITAMNALQCSAMATDAIMAKHNTAFRCGMSI